MNRKQLDIRALELRSKLRELASADDLTEEQRSEMAALTRESGEVDQKIAAAIAGEEPPSERSVQGVERDELVELRSQANAGDVFEAVMAGSVPAGATRDYQQALGLRSNSIPIELIEERAAASAAIPAAVSHTPTTLQQQQVVDAVFPTKTAEMMGVRRVRVPVGQAAFPVVSAPEDAPEGVAEGATVGDTTATLTAEALSPLRLQRSFTYSVEDAAVFPQLDATLRDNLRQSMEAALDRQALTLTDQGLLQFGTDPTADGTTETYELLKAACYGQIDGRYANDIGMVKLLVGQDTLSLMASLYRSGGSDAVAFVEWAKANLGWIGVSAYVPDESNANTQEAVFCRGMMGAAVQPVWPSIDVINDPSSESQDGNVRLTARGLANFRVIRAAQYTRALWDLS